jgi:hypothetical protein
MLRGLGVSAVVIAVGLLVPPVGWIVLYLAPVWFVVTGVLLASATADREKTPDVTRGRSTS